MQDVVPSASWNDPFKTGAHMRTLIVAITLIVFPPQAPAQSTDPARPPVVGPTVQTPAGTNTNYFKWGVESLKVEYGTTSGTFDVQWFRGTTQDCTVSHSGKCSMRLNVAGNDRGNQQMGADLIQWNPPYPFNMLGGPSIYYRTWMKIMPGFRWGAPGVGNVKTQRSVLNLPQNRFMTGHMRSNGFLIAECEFVSGFGGGCLTPGGVPNNDYNIRIPYDMQGKADGQWHEYILRIKPNTTATATDAEFQVWVDGVSIGQLTGWRLTNMAAAGIEAWGGWMVTPYFQLNGTANDGGTIYLDDFSTDSTYNSLL